MVHAFNAEAYQNEKFDGPSTEMMNTQLKNQRLMAVIQPLMGLCMNGLALVIYWLGAALINQIAVTDAAARLNMFSNVVVFFSTYATYVVMSFMMMVMIFMMFPSAQVSAERINEVLDSVNTVREGEVTQSPEKGTVEFRNVSFPPIPARRRNSSATSASAWTGADACRHRRDRQRQDNARPAHSPLL